MKKGMTLIEILVTALILVIALTSLMSTFVFCTKLSIRNAHRHNATLIINQHFEEILRQESSQALNDYISTKNESIHYRQATYQFNSNTNRYYLTFADAGTINPTPTTTLRVLEASVTWSSNFDNPDPLDVVSMRLLSNEPNL